ncbi:MAG TPA: DNA mismatch repair protein MutS, partial [Candidatus Krumholzibacteria bacterium]|nr:DNA mismatch repair protein MutS [Candidatus Krumholzibacteria bacterium]
MGTRRKSGEHTPMMEQYLGLKAEHPDAILLFRMGDFYETFFEDAQLCSRVLGITLTSREKKGGKPIPLAGIPFHALEQYLKKLLKSGATVAICEQTEDPARAKGLVRREVVEILSPGTVTNPALLSSDEGSYLLALLPKENEWGYALLDGSTGEFLCGQAPAEEVLGLPRRYPVAEILLPQELVEEGRARTGGGALEGIHATGVSDLLFETDYATRTLEDHFKLNGITGLGLDGAGLATRAAGCALRYLADRQRSLPAQVSQLSVQHSAEQLYLDRETVAHLELFASLQNGKREGTLFAQMDATKTPMGRRCLAAWLRSPLRTRSKIERRLDAVQALREDPVLLRSLRESLNGIGDVERILGRIATGRAMPKELANLRASLLRVEAIHRLQWAGRDPILQEILDKISSAGELNRPLITHLTEEPPLHLRKGGILREGVHRELDELADLARGGKKWLANYQARERERTGISSLKVAFNRVFGYYIEVTRSHLSKVPGDYQEKQTLAAAKRYVTEDLKERERQILSAEERRIELEKKLYLELLESLAASLVPLRTLTAALGRLDTLGALAALSLARDYVRPEIDESGVLLIEEGRHPVVEKLVQEPFVPNDLAMDSSERQILLLTGPNMGGKSTYLRQAALLVIMAQMGSFVPARRARIGLTDRLFTRVGASDNLARGQSTFLVEMAECAKILRGSTDQSLVILDEVGRGTSTDDGLALAWAITEHLHDGPVHPKALFATHFHELTQLVESLPRLANIQMEVRDWQGQILFLHRVIPGAGDRSYGIHVAELAGIPPSVLRRAREL